MQDTLTLCGTQCVELQAVMAKYSPFAEKAGMHRIMEQHGSPDAVKIGETLSELGFNLETLGSKTYIIDKLRSISPLEVDKIRSAIIKHQPLRLRKMFQSKMPYGTTEVFEKGVRDADEDRLADLLKTIGFLLQTKVYLFWKARKINIQEILDSSARSIWKKKQVF